ncbi:sex comb on midleg-like protein 1 isoform X1 [Mus musculus]|uniref:sex comb on midleg-like protein 1 isoform 1 n=1 Tax=Mus musculus TaxID=10090 RepID=UPI0000F5159F|nr:sex comb on midleg-like protein 1 isoform 1 [Mus musculus]NP_001361134.1 sex comb on midleg-like protein 1 isoform 1 [Mus musculus]XP_036017756.1 sex comb on midleg-like protein 1 isoform X1 [Mus musculus]
MSATGEEDGNILHPPEIHEIQEIEGPQAIETLLNYCQIIFKTVQRMEKRFNEIDEKLTKVYYARSRSFWNYPPLKSATRKYNYLTPKKRRKVQKVREVVDDDPFAYPQSYSPTSPVRRREGYNQDMENIEPMDCTLPFQYTDTIDNSQTFQYTDTIDNSQTFQYTDTVDLSQTVQYTDTVDLNQTVQYTDTVDLNQTVQYTDTVDLSQTLQNTDTVDLSQTVQYTDTVDLNQTVQYTDTVDLNQTVQNTDTVDLSQTLQNTDTVDLSQTLQNTDTVNNAQPFQYTNTVNNTVGIQNTENNDVFHSENSQEAVLVRSSLERDYQETPPSPTYTTESYEQYYRLRNVPGSSTMPFYSDIEIPNMDTITSAPSTSREASTLPPGELIPIRNPEMRRRAFLEALLTPVIDPNTFGSSSECTRTVVRHLGYPVNWSVNDVITFLNRLDPPLADQLYPTIKKHDIDGKAMLLISSDTMIKYMGVKVGVAMKFENYIRTLKEKVNCGQ